MNVGNDQLQVLLAEWRSACFLYPVYLGIGERFQLEVPSCPELQSPIDVPDDAALSTVRRWFQRMDQTVQVHQLRVFLQTGSLCTEDVLRELARHHLRAAEDDAGRDKLDFLLVQYFSQCAPPATKSPTLEDVAVVLRPVLGEVIPELPDWARPLETALERLGCCASMRELLHAEVLREVREIKEAAGREYFAASSLVAFTRFNYLLRQAFFRLMRADVEAVKHGVRELDGLGISAIDCRRASLSDAEPLVRVLKTCQQWRKPFQEEYSAGNPFAQIAELRVAVEDALSAARPEKWVQAARSESLQETPSHLSACPEIEMLLERLPSHLKADPRSRQAGATILSCGSRLVLSPAEVRAFVDGTGPMQDLVRRAVVCRLVLFQSLEQSKRNGRSERLPSIIAAAKAEVELLRGVLADARLQGRPSATLSAASKRLSDLVGKTGNL